MYIKTTIQLLKKTEVQKLFLKNKVYIQYIFQLRSKIDIFQP